MPEHFAAAAALLPPGLRAAALNEPQTRRAACEELRLRLGHPPALRLPEGERTFSETPLCPADLAAVLEAATGASLHAYGDQLRRGFVCAPGGVRVGVCILAGRVDIVAATPKLPVSVLVFQFWDCDLTPQYLSHYQIPDMLV